MSNLDPTTQMLLLILVGAVIVLFVLIIVYIVLKTKGDRKKSSNYNIKNSTDKSSLENKINSDGKQSIFNFMEFDKIEDNMIIQNNGKKYIMAIECQGVNYDLMSGVEKAGVEESFVQFLNTLRHPIQLYIQTRTINLENSINGYKSRVNQIESNLFNMNQRYNLMLESDEYSKAELNRMFYEITKQRNLYEYGKDIIKSTEKMSLNKNILNKKYYIIISYYSSELGKSEVDKSELQSIAFSELYTRAQSTIRAISPCGVNGKILNSQELAELLYVAYNRDESETLNLKKVVRADYDRLYSTAPDVLEKKMKEIDKVIEQRAMDKVTEKVEKFRTKNRKKLEEKEQQSIEDLADEMAKLIIAENEQYLGADVVEEILKEEGGEKDEKKETKRRTRKTSNAKQ